MMGHNRRDGVETMREDLARLRQIGAVGTGVTRIAGTPKDVVARLTADSIKATRSPDFVKRMTELGYVILGTSAEQMAEMTQTELKRWPPVVRASGASVD